ncbi:MAG TPA: hypothetical protein VEC57_01615 [Candidatus Limnocylindrales bacterium]|nr:hypothetical protein [Candidatus Limnocylindrales bacterium]
MRRAILAAGVLVATVLLLVVALYATLPLWSGTELVRSELQRQLLLAGYDVQAASVRMDRELSVTATDVVIRDAGGREVAAAPLVEVFNTLRLQPPYLVTTARLIRPRLSIDRTGEDGSVLRSLLATALPAPLERLEIEEGAVRIGDAATARGTLVLDQHAGALGITATTLDISDPSATRAAEKLAGRLRLERLPREAASTDQRYALELQIGSGSALWDEVLVDLGAFPVSAAATATAAAKTVDLDIASAELRGLLKMQAAFTWTLQDELSRCSLHLSAENLERSFDKLVREPFGAAYPALANLTVTGKSSVRMTITGAGSDAPAISGVVHAQSLRASSPAFLLDDLTARIPFFSRNAEPVVDIGGTLAAADLRIGGIRFGPFRIESIARAGRLDATAPVTLRVGGGALTLEDLALVEREERTLQLRARGLLRDVDLSRLLQDAGWPAVQGRLEGDLGGMAMDPVALSVTGAATAHVFGGRVHLRDMSIGTPFSRVSVFRLDAVAEDLQLAEMTQALPFGHIRGVLEGHVNDLEIAAGQLQSFDVDLHSVPRPGVAQTISVRALSKLSALGGADASLGGIALRLVNEFRYSRLGVRGSLRNDQFELHGVERADDGGEYLVKGSLLPPTVNVISHTQRMSFSEMLSRLRSLGEEEGEARDATSQ